MKRFHLSSLLCVCVTTGVLVGVNVRCGLDVECKYEKITDEGLLPVQFHYAAGWPLRMYWVSAAPHIDTSMDVETVPSVEKEILELRPLPYIGQGNGYWSAWRIVGNVPMWIGMILFAGWLGSKAGTFRLKAVRRAPTSE